MVGTGVLWSLLRYFSLSEVLGTSGTLATVIAVAAACDVARDDTGLIAAIVMGIALANLPGFDIPARRPFFQTVVQLIIGILFISISATVTPESVRNVLWGVTPKLGGSRRPAWRWHPVASSRTPPDAVRSSRASALCC